MHHRDQLSEAGTAALSEEHLTHTAGAPEYSMPKGVVTGRIS
jgi:hypothetical protein